MRYHIIQNRQGRVIAQRRSLNRAIEFIESQSISSRNEFVIYDIHNGESFLCLQQRNALRYMRRPDFGVRLSQVVPSVWVNENEVKELVRGREKGK